MSKTKCKFKHLKIGGFVDIGTCKQWILHMSRDEVGLKIVGDGGYTIDYYRPKYCPECGKKLIGKGV